MPDNHETNAIIHGDCIEQLMSLPEQSVDLAFCRSAVQHRLRLRRLRRQPRPSRLSRLVAIVDPAGASDFEIVGHILAGHRR